MINVELDVLTMRKPDTWLSGIPIPITKFLWNDEAVVRFQKAMASAETELKLDIIRAKINKKLSTTTAINDELVKLVVNVAKSCVKFRNAPRRVQIRQLKHKRWYDASLKDMKKTIKTLTQEIK